MSQWHPTKLGSRRVGVQSDFQKKKIQFSIATILLLGMLKVEVGDQN